MSLINPLVVVVVVFCVFVALVWVLVFFRFFLLV